MIKDLFIESFKQNVKYCYIWDILVLKSGKK